jgi:hypothetical protein
MDEDKAHRTLQDFVEQMAVGIAHEVVDGEKIEKIQNECKILNSLTEALKAIKN